MKSLKEKMAEEAYKMINEDGYDSFTIRALSKRLHVSHNAMYKHFSSKSHLFHEVVKLGFDVLTSAFLQTRERSDINDLEKLKEFLYVYIEFAIKNPYVYRLMYDFDDSDNEFLEDHINIFKNSYMAIMETAEKFVKTGKVKRTSMISVTNTAWAFIHGFALLLVDNIIPKTKNINSQPQLLNTFQNNEKEIPIRDIAKYSIDVIYDGLIS